MTVFADFPLDWLDSAAWVDPASAEEDGVGGLFFLT